jgi:lipooligosaccharide transport system ATP-binding protein
VRPKRIGVVTQFDSLDPDFNGAENLHMVGRHSACRAAISGRVPRLLAFAALHRKPGPSSVNCRVA